MTIRYRFHVAVHARPDEAPTGSLLMWQGQSYQTLAVLPTCLSRPLAFSFEETSGKLQLLPRMFLEPDGSFVWVSADPDQPWQVDGLLFDRDGRVLYLELKGTCPPAAFEQLLATCGWPDVPLVFQSLRQAVFLDELQFRLFAENS